MVIDLRPLTEAKLPVVEAWFEDPETRRFLGGPGWPTRSLGTLVGQEFRGALQLGAYRWLAWEGAQPVGYIDCGTFDRFVVYGGEGPHGPIIHSTIERRTGHIAIVVDPGRRRRGVGRAMIRALLDRPELEDASLLVAGIEPDNVASLRCFEAVGFRCRAEEPDWEGMLDLVLDRGGPA